MMRKFSTTVYTGTKSRDVETYTESKQVVNGYDLVQYCTCSNSTKIREFRDFSINGDFGGYGLDLGYGEEPLTAYASFSQVTNAIQVPIGSRGWANPYDGYNKGTKTAYILSAGYADGERLWFISSERYTTQNTTYYKYRERTSYTQYFYWKWDAYSAWQDDEVAITADRDVKTKKVYNYRMK